MLKSAAQKTLLVGLSFSLLACSGGGRSKTGQGVFASGLMPVRPGCRLAAVMTLTDPSTGAASSQPMQPIQQPTGISAIGDQPGLNGQRGQVEILSICEDQNPFIGADGSIINVPTGMQGGGVRGNRTGIAMPLRALSAESRMAFTTEGGLLFVTVPEDSSVIAIPVGDNGAFGVPFRPFDVPARPSELAVAHNSRFGELVVVAHSQGISIFDVNRMDIRTGSPVPDTLIHKIRVGYGYVTDLKFTPSGEYLMLGYSVMPRGAINTTGGAVLICNVDSILEGTESAFQSFAELGRGRGCFPGDPRMVSNSLAMGGNPGFGSQVVQGIPKKLAVNGQMAVYLSDRLGPARLATPSTGDIDNYFDSVLQTGYFEQLNFFGSTPDFTRRNYFDIALHPNANTILVTEKNRLLVYAVDNEYATGTVRDQIENFQGNLVDLELDPGPTPKFVLIAEQMRNRVWIGELSAIGVRPPTNGIPVFGTPVSLAIRPRTARASFVPGQTPEAQPQQ